MMQHLLDMPRRGINRLLNLLDPPVVILIYHRVTVLESDPQLLAVSPDNFRSQMRFLRNNFPVLRLDEKWRNVREPSVVVTFDDGYADNALEALPIIEEEGVPATFFISTGDLGTTKEFWWDELERILLTAGDFPPVYECAVGRDRRVWRTATPVQREDLYRDLHPFMRKLRPEKRNAWLESIRNWCGAGGPGRNSHRPLLADELRLLGTSAVATVGAHTVSHSVLSALTPEEQKEEIFGSKRTLEELIGKEVTVFSYPFGCKKDYTDETIRLCREAGFIRAAANFPGQAHRWSDPYQLPRQLARNWDERQFSEMMRRFLLS